MNLSISNIGWDSPDDASVYSLMKKYDYSGLEIAPTRIFPGAPYDQLEEAKAWSIKLKKEHGFTVSSMQSIWYGRQENIFRSVEERNTLLHYTKQAIDFAQVIGCGNLVFGCPRNRNIPEGAGEGTAIDFFRELGDYAAENGTVIGLEANPPIYNTNYINDTASALELVKKVDSKGFLLNLDVGTIIWNEEDVSELEGNVHLVNHVHISEPGLKPIEERALHSELSQILLANGYSGYVSIEMGKVEDISIIEDSLQYIGKIFTNE